MLETRTLFTSQSDTIISGAFELMLTGAPGIAVVILVASVGIPLAKFFAIAFLALSVRGGSRLSAGTRMRLYEIVEYIGRWSMIDVFVVAILASLVQLNIVASIDPGPRLPRIRLSVIFTMLSAQAFDPRLIWDSIEAEARPTRAAPPHAAPAPPPRPRMTDSRPARSPSPPPGGASSTACR
jgi:paraquat-inducible protein A